MNLCISFFCSNHVDFSYQLRARWAMLSPTRRLRCFFFTSRALSFPFLLPPSGWDLSVFSVRTLSFRSFDRTHSDSPFEFSAGASSLPQVAVPECRLIFRAIFSSLCQASFQRVPVFFCNPFFVSGRLLRWSKPSSPVGRCSQTFFHSLLLSFMSFLQASTADFMSAASYPQHGWRAAG